MMSGLRRKKILSSPLIFVGFRMMSYSMLMLLARVVSSNSQQTQASSDHMISSHSYKRKHNEVPSKYTKIEVINLIKFNKKTYNIYT